MIPSVLNSNLNTDLGPESASLTNKNLSSLDLSKESLPSVDLLDQPNIRLWFSDKAVVYVKAYSSGLISFVGQAQRKQNSEEPPPFNLSFSEQLKNWLTHERAIPLENFESKNSIMTFCIEELFRSVKNFFGYRDLSPDVSFYSLTGSCIECLPFDAYPWREAFKSAGASEELIEELLLCIKNRPFISPNDIDLRIYASSNEKKTNKKTSINDCQEKLKEVVDNLFFEFAQRLYRQINSEKISARPIKNAHVVHALPQSSQEDEKIIRKYANVIAHQYFCSEKQKTMYDSLGRIRKMVKILHPKLKVALPGHSKNSLEVSLEIIFFGKLMVPQLHQAGLHICFDPWVLQDYNKPLRFSGVDVWTGLWSIALNNYMLVDPSSSEEQVWCRLIRAYSQGKTCLNPEDERIVVQSVKYYAERKIKPDLDLNEHENVQQIEIMFLLNIFFKNHEKNILIAYVALFYNAKRTLPSINIPFVKRDSNALDALEVLILEGLTDSEMGFNLLNSLVQLASFLAMSFNYSQAARRVLLNFHAGKYAFSVSLKEGEEVRFLLIPVNINEALFLLDQNLTDKNIHFARLLIDELCCGEFQDSNEMANFFVSMDLNIDLVRNLVSSLCKRQDLDALYLALLFDRFLLKIKVQPGGSAELTQATVSVEFMKQLFKAISKTGGFEETNTINKLKTHLLHTHSHIFPIIPSGWGDLAIMRTSYRNYFISVNPEGSPADWMLKEPFAGESKEEFLEDVRELIKIYAKKNFPAAIRLLYFWRSTLEPQEIWDKLKSIFSYFIEISNHNDTLSTLSPSETSKSLNCSLKSVQGLVALSNAAVLVELCFDTIKNDSKNNLEALFLIFQHYVNQEQVFKRMWELLTNLFSKTSPELESHCFKFCNEALVLEDHKEIKKFIGRLLQHTGAMQRLNSESRKELSLLILKLKIKKDMLERTVESFINQPKKRLLGYLLSNILVHLGQSVPAYQLVEFFPETFSCLPSENRHAFLVLFREIFQNTDFEKLLTDTVSEKILADPDKFLDIWIETLIASSDTKLQLIAEKLLISLSLFNFNKNVPKLIGANFSLVLDALIKKLTMSNNISEIDRKIYLRCFELIIENIPKSPEKELVSELEAFAKQALKMVRWTECSLPLSFLKLLNWEPNLDARVAALMSFQQAHSSLKAEVSLAWLSAAKANDSWNVFCAAKKQQISFHDLPNSTEKDDFIDVFIKSIPAVLNEVDLEMLLSFCDSHPIIIEKIQRVLARIILLIAQEPAKNTDKIFRRIYSLLTPSTVLDYAIALSESSDSQWRVYVMQKMVELQVPPDLILKFFEVVVTILGQHEPKWSTEQHSIFVEKIIQKIPKDFQLNIQKKTFEVLIGFLPPILPKISLTEPLIFLIEKEADPVKCFSLLSLVSNFKGRQELKIWQNKILNLATELALSNPGMVWAWLIQTTQHRILFNEDKIKNRLTELLYSVLPSSFSTEDLNCLAVFFDGNKMNPINERVTHLIFKSLKEAYTATTSPIKTSIKNLEDFYKFLSPSQSLKLTHFLLKRLIDLNELECAAEWIKKGLLNNPSASDLELLKESVSQLMERNIEKSFPILTTELLFEKQLSKTVPKMFFLRAFLVMAEKVNFSCSMANKLLKEFIYEESINVNAYFDSLVKIKDKIDFQLFNQGTIDSLVKISHLKECSGKASELIVIASEKKLELIIDPKEELRIFKGAIAHSLNNVFFVEALVKRKEQLNSTYSEILVRSFLDLKSPELAKKWLDSCSLAVKDELLKKIFILFAEMKRDRECLALVSSSGNPNLFLDELEILLQRDFSDRECGPLAELILITEPMGLKIPEKLFSYCVKELCSQSNKKHFLLLAKLLVRYECTSIIAWRHLWKWIADDFVGVGLFNHESDEKKNFIEKLLLNFYQSESKGWGVYEPIDMYKTWISIICIFRKIQTDRFPTFLNKYKDLKWDSWPVALRIQMKAYLIENYLEYAYETGHSQLWDLVYSKFQEFKKEELVLVGACDFNWDYLCQVRLASYGFRFGKTSFFSSLLTFCRNFFSDPGLLHKLSADLYDEILLSLVEAEETPTASEALNLGTALINSPKIKTSHHLLMTQFLLRFSDFETLTTAIGFFHLHLEAADYKPNHDVVNAIFKKMESFPRDALTKEYMLLYLTPNIRLTIGEKNRLSKLNDRVCEKIEQVCYSKNPVKIEEMISWSTQIFQEFLGDMTYLELNRGFVKLLIALQENSPSLFSKRKLMKQLDILFNHAKTINNHTISILEFNSAACLPNSDFSLVKEVAWLFMEYYHSSSVVRRGYWTILNDFFIMLASSKNKKEHLKQLGPTLCQMLAIYLNEVETPQFSFIKETRILLESYKSDLEAGGFSIPICFLEGFPAEYSDQAIFQIREACDYVKTSPRSPILFQRLIYCIQLQLSLIVEFDPNAHQNLDEIFGFVVAEAKCCNWYLSNFSPLDLVFLLFDEYYRLIFFSKNFQEEINILKRHTNSLIEGLEQKFKSKCDHLSKTKNGCQNPEYLLIDASEVRLAFLSLVVFLTRADLADWRPNVLSSFEPILLRAILELIPFIPYFWKTKINGEKTSKEEEQITSRFKNIIETLSSEEKANVFTCLLAKANEVFKNSYEDLMIVHRMVYSHFIPKYQIVEGDLLESD